MSADFDEGLLDLVGEWAVAQAIASLADPELASDELRLMLGADSSARVWADSVPEEKPAEAAWDDFYPCIIVSVITPVTDIYALTNDHPGDHVIGTVRIEVKAIGKGTGFKRLKPVKRFIYSAFEGADGVDVEGGSIGSCLLFQEWPRTKEPTENGPAYYHSGYQFDVIAQRGE